MMKEHEIYLYRFCSVTLMITFNILQQKSVKNNLTVTAKSSIISSFFFYNSILHLYCNSYKNEF